jgi:hypothetical protein
MTTIDGATLTFCKNNGHTLTINNYDKATSSLGIDLHDVRVSVKIGDNFERVVA